MTLYAQDHTAIKEQMAGLGFKHRQSDFTDQSFNQDTILGFCLRSHQLNLLNLFNNDPRCIKGIPEI